MAAISPNSSDEPLNKKEITIKGTEILDQCCSDSEVKQSEKCIDISELCSSKSHGSRTAESTDERVGGIAHLNCEVPIQMEETASAAEHPDHLHKEPENKQRKDVDVDEFQSSGSTEIVVTVEKTSGAGEGSHPTIEHLSNIDFKETEIPKFLNQNGQNNHCSEICVTAETSLFPCSVAIVHSQNKEFSALEKASERHFSLGDAPTLAESVTATNMVIGRKLNSDIHILHDDTVKNDGESNEAMCTDGLGSGDTLVAEIPGRENLENDANSQVPSCDAVHNDVLGLDFSERTPTSGNINECNKYPAGNGFSIKADGEASGHCTKIQSQTGVKTNQDIASQADVASNCEFADPPCSEYQATCEIQKRGVSDYGAVVTTVDSVDELNSMNVDQSDEQPKEELVSSSMPITACGSVSGTVVSPRQVHENFLLPDGNINSSNSIQISTDLLVKITPSDARNSLLILETTADIDQNTQLADVHGKTSGLLTKTSYNIEQKAIMFEDNFEPPKAVKQSAGIMDSLSTGIERTCIGIESGTSDLQFQRSVFNSSLQETANPNDVSQDNTVNYNTDTGPCLLIIEEHTSSDYVQGADKNGSCNIAVSDPTFLSVPKEPTCVVEQLSSIADHDKDSQAVATEPQNDAVTASPNVGSVENDLKNDVDASLALRPIVEHQAASTGEICTTLTAGPGIGSHGMEPPDTNSDECFKVTDTGDEHDGGS